MFLTTFLGYQTTTAVNPQSFDAFGVTYRGVTCGRHNHFNSEIYAQANFACMGGKLNQTINSRRKNVGALVGKFEGFVRRRVTDSWSMGTLHLAPLFRKDVKERQNIFLTEHKGVGPDILVLNEDCEVVTAVTYKLTQVEKQPYTNLEIHICNKFQ
ncbi:hypothetical protein GcM3_096028 [Golovinomyces cichoracearum]|uniref:Uncharacterized protein n=1 Tax=Golovinomyces cichoracearum TaxID=62708 RepID=A0A420IE72_9PEZI|nr:hypothetical protein GcM3_096028 [Golovinomyces cichoracearum]